jgi:hypothetical protein
MQAAAWSEKYTEIHFRLKGDKNLFSRPPKSQRSEATPDAVRLRNEQEVVKQKIEK